MTLEEQLINKTYFEVTFMKENEQNHPIQVLGDVYLSEQQNEVPDLAYIRFAQGEVYFHNRDFEAAIFKWENIDNELEPWAKKNMADAYMELGLVSNAKDIYKSIHPESSTLHAEVSLQLFSLYIGQGEIDLADKVLKEVVSLNPDYPDVTEMARVFYEEQEMWHDAVDLAVNEAIRTESVKWFDHVNAYAKKGWTQTYEPAYFIQLLMTVQKVDQNRFEQIVSSFWNIYRNRESYLSWMKVLDTIFSQIEVNKSDTWHTIPSIYKESYFDLINGQYFVKEISSIIPNLLTDWLKISEASQGLFASSAILAWNEIFPESIDPSVINDAEYRICHASKFEDVFAHSLKLFESIVKWAEEHELEVGQRMKWMVQELMDVQVHHLMIAGPTGNGKSSFINSILGENILKASSSSIVMFKDIDSTEINEITDMEVKVIKDLSEFHSTTATQLQTKCIDFKMPCTFLNKNNLSIIDTPSFNGNLKEKNEWFHYLQLADSLVFVLNANVPFTDKECDILLQIQKHAPGLPLHFVLNKIDTIYSEQEAVKIIEETESRLAGYFPNAKVFPYTSIYESDEQLSQLLEYTKSTSDKRSFEEGRAEKLLYFIRKMITDLLEKRVEIENDIIELISWNEDIVGRLNGALNQLRDVESEKINLIQREYQIIKEDVRNELITTIPKMLRDSSDFIKEDSDFRKIHLELNDEMNNRIQDYLHNKILPKFYGLLKRWIASSHDEFNQCKLYLDEMCGGLNGLYGEQRLKLEFDFKVIDDWSRDADRMTNAVQIEKVNIFLRHTPTQLLLKGAGKLFGAIPQNKTMLYNKYKSFIENEDFYQAAVIIANKFLQQFDLFEKGLERDITMFFRNPLNIMNEIMEETHIKIQKNKDLLMSRRANPERYKDPLTLFELKLRQYEWIKDVGKEIQPIY